MEQNKINIEEQLNHLILKYKIDCQNKRFSKYVKVVEILNLIADGTKKDIILVGDKNTNLDKIENAFQDGQKVKQKIVLETNSNVALEKQNSCYFIMSYENHDKMYDMLTKQYSALDIVDFYQRMKENNIEIAYNFYDVVNQGLYKIGTKEYDLYRVIYEDRKALTEMTTQEERTIILQRLIFEYLYIRDFVYAKKRIQEYIENKYEGYERYERFLKELAMMFADVKHILEKRKNIVNFWLDAVDYEQEKKMPFLYEESKKSVYFENAYTCTAYTGPTMTAIIAGKYEIDDEGYKIKELNRDNGKLIKILEKNNYLFQYIGFHSYTINAEFCSQRNISRWEPSMLVLWELLREMLDGKKSTMYMPHIFLETHIPWLTGNIDSNYYEEFYQDAMALNKAKDKSDKLEKRRCAREYIDKQLEFYSNLLGEECTKIYMSDHGDAMDDNLGLYYKKIHTILFVKNKFQTAKRLKGLFSYTDYYQLIDQLIKKNMIEEVMCKTYVKVQGIDYCNRNLIGEQLTKEKLEPLLLLGYRGVMCAEDYYVWRTDGYESYGRDGSDINFIKFDKYQERINELRQIAGRTVPDIYTDEKFRYARATHKVMKHYYARIGKEELGITLLKQYVDSIENDKCIGIRGGGKHTSEVLSILGDRYKRIQYIIDKNTERSNVLGIPIISFDEFKKKHVDVVIISSLNYRHEMKRELESQNLNYEIYDIYKELEKRGIELTKGFYEQNFLDEDFEGITLE